MEALVELDPEGLAAQLARGVPARGGIGIGGAAAAAVRRVRRVLRAVPVARQLPVRVLAGGVEIVRPGRVQAPLLDGHSAPDVQPYYARKRAGAKRV